MSDPSPLGKARTGIWWIEQPVWDASCGEYAAEAFCDEAALLISDSIPSLFKHRISKFLQYPQGNFRLDHPVWPTHPQVNALNAWTDSRGSGSTARWAWQGWIPILMLHWKLRRSLDTLAAKVQAGPCSRHTCCYGRGFKLLSGSPWWNSQWMPVIS